MVVTLPDICCFRSLYRSACLFVALFLMQRPMYYAVCIAQVDLSMKNS